MTTLLSISEAITETVSVGLVWSLKIKTVRFAAIIIR